MKVKLVLAQINSQPDHILANLHLGPSRFQWTVITTHLGSLEAAREAGWVHFITVQGEGSAKTTALGGFFTFVSELSDRGKGAMPDLATVAGYQLKIPQKGEHLPHRLLGGNTIAEIDDVVNKRLFKLNEVR
jgi:hypothetical protein